MKDTLLSLGGFALLTGLAISQQFAEQRLPAVSETQANDIKGRLNELEEDLAGGYRFVFQAKGANPEELRASIDEFQRLNQGLEADVIAEKNALAALAARQPAQQPPVAVDASASPNARALAEIQAELNEGLAAIRAQGGSPERLRQLVEEFQSLNHESISQKRQLEDALRLEAGAAAMVTPTVADQQAAIQASRVSSESKDTMMRELENARAVDAIRKSNLSPEEVRQRISERQSNAP